MWVLTAIYFAVPVAFLLADDSRLSAAAAGLLALALAVYGFGRPTHFEISDAELSIVWPLRSQRLRRSDVTGASVLSREAFQQRFGRAVRLGIGGLFGQFGWAWTRDGLVTTYVSTLGPFVLLELREGRPLVFTPEEPDAFVAALRS